MVESSNKPGQEPEQEPEQMPAAKSESNSIPKPSLRELLVCAVLIVIVSVFFVLNIAMPSPEVLQAERRMPAKFPELSMKTISSGSFMSKFDDYAADNFAFRDAFRGVNSFIVFDLYMQHDMSGLYRDKSIGLGEYRRTNASSFRQSAQKVDNAAKSFDGMDMNIYYSLIPDKSIYAENYMPGFDLQAAESILDEVLSEYKYIRIADVLGASDFYRTDLHWDQSRIGRVADFLLSSMDAGNARTGDPTGGDPTSWDSTGGDPTGGYPISVAGDFFGLYAGQIALPVKADTLSYADIPGLRVSYLNEKTLEFEAGPVYDLERFTGVDPYDTFLRGPQPLIVLENDTAPERELYLFRDSFGSSLAPLLAASYSRITIIDLRYINLMLLDMFIEFTPGSDVLFIYGSQIYNNPSVLQA